MLRMQIIRGPDNSIFYGGKDHIEADFNYTSYLSIAPQQSLL